MDRRNFLRTVAAAVGVGSVASAETTAPEPDETPDLHNTMQRETIDAEVVGGATPIVIDPEILDIVQMDAPFYGEYPSQHDVLELEVN